MRTRLATLILAAGVALGGCGYNGLGLGLGYGSGDYYGGYGYGPYGGYYGSPYYGLGYGSRYGYGGYGSPYYGLGSYYGGFGSPYFGWYDNFYYPGSGIYVYDVYRRPHVWTDRQRVYWSSRRPVATTSTSTKTTVVKPNWSGFNRDRTVRTSGVTLDRPTRSERLQPAQERLQQVQERRSQRMTTRSSRQRTRPISEDD